MISRISYKYIGLIYLLAGLTCAANPCHIQVVNTSNQARIILRFDRSPVYSYVFLNNKKELILNINNIDVSKILELNFTKDTFIKSIQYFNDKNHDSQNKLILKFQDPAEIKTSKALIKSEKDVVLIITKFSPNKKTLSDDSIDKNDIKSDKSHIRNRKINKKIIIALDAGHGGYDPGAIGQHGLHEKVITFKIACKLQKLLNQDPMFDCFLIRNNDQTIYLLKRMDIAREKHANLLISIHADSTFNHSIHGGSTWILSHSRIHREINKWLKYRQQELKFLAGIGPLFIHFKIDAVLTRVILDVEYSYWNNISNAMSLKVLKQLKELQKSTFFQELQKLTNKIKLAKKTTQWASLGILCSPDIPSVIVETGFISNAKEEQLLAMDSYQDKLAESIYKGLRNYFFKNSYPDILTTTKLLTLHINNNSVNHNKEYIIEDMKYLVKEGDTLYRIAAKYGVTTIVLSHLNHLKSSKIYIGQFLTITNNKK